jgi:hypothetical protein
LLEKESSFQLIKCLFDQLKDFKLKKKNYLIKKVGERQKERLREREKEKKIKERERDKEVKSRLKKSVGLKFVFV